MRIETEDCRWQQKYINDDKPEGDTYMEHVQCQLYFCIAGADFTHDIISFQVAFEEGSMCLFDKESLDIFKGSVDKL